MHSNNPIVPYISLCSGYEGIGLGLHRCIPNLRCVAYCEREAFAIANLVAKMESGLLDAAPVFTDVTNFPWADYAPYMAGGILSFGWPCQPVSCAGKRKATEDERWLFDIIADGISILRPGMLFAENVEGLLSARMPDGSSVFGHCIERLESLHYKVAAGIFSASEVGAPHQRKRVFILAHDQSQASGGLCQRTQQEIAQLGLNGKARHLADPSGVGHGQEGIQDGIHKWSFSLKAQSHRSECRELRSATIGCGIGNVWPSRPGEPQHGWEPPRVIVANASSQRGGSESGDALHEGRTASETGRESLPQDAGRQDGAAIPDDQPTGGDGAEDVANSQRSGGEEPEHLDANLSPEPSGCDTESVGNAECRGRASGYVNGAATKNIGAGCVDGNEAMGNSSRQRCKQDSALRGEQQPSGTSEERGTRDAEESNGQAERTMGLHIDGTPDGLGHAELSSLCDTELAEIREWMVKCDNRTDELRLLGNGVVWQTAERAFRVLTEELFQEK